MCRLAVCLLVVALFGSRLNAQPPAPPDLTIVVDTSGSMAQNNRIEDAREAAKLACLILDGRVQFVGFSDAADVSDVFDLKTQRAEAIRWLDRLKPTAGTRYVPALEATARHAPKGIVFISDGAPSDSPKDALDLIAAKIRCPLHTIAVETTDEARTLLGKMAAATTGGMHPVDSPTQIVDVFLGILGQVRPFARLDTTADRHELRDVSGDVIAIGLGCVPDLGGKEPVATVTLAGARVHLTRTTVAARGPVTATTKQAAKSRLILLRFDQAVASMTLGPPSVRDGKASVRAEVQFAAPAGKPLDPRTAGSGLSAEFELVTADGRVVQKSTGLPAAARPALGATFEVPVTGTAPVPFVVRSRVTDSSSGAPFVSTNSQAVVVDPSKAPTPPLAPVTVVAGVGGRDGEPIRGTVTIRPDGGSPVERQAFLDALLAAPPVVAAEWAGGRRTDSAATPAAFDTRSKLDGGAFVLSVAFRPTERAGEFTLSVPEGTAAGARYPAGRTRVRCVAAVDLQFLIVAKRHVRDRVVLYDSAQKAGQLEPALHADALTLELVRGSRIDPREFASLGQGLRARTIADDGATADIALTLQQDRYVTPVLRARGPGRLRVHVEIAVEGLELRLDGEVAVEKVDVRLAPDPARRLSALPRGALVRQSVGVVGADRDRLVEVLRRDGLTLRWSLTDGAGTTLATADRAAEVQPWSTQFRVGSPGDMRFTQELIDAGGAVLESRVWAFKATDSPLQTAVYARGRDGGLKPLPAQRAAHAWLPSWCVSKPELVVSVRPAKSPFYVNHHLATVQIGGQAVAFDDASSEFRGAVPPGEVTCIGTLRPYGWSTASLGDDTAELQVAETVSVPEVVELRPVPTILTGAAALLVLLALPLGGWYARRASWRRALARVALRVRVYGGLSGAPPLVGCDRHGRFSHQLVLCGRPGDPASLRLVRPGEATGEAVVRLEQHRDGSVSATALIDLVELRAGETCRLRLPGKANLVLTRFLSLAVEPLPTAAR